MSYAKWLLEWDASRPLDVPYYNGTYALAEHASDHPCDVRVNGDPEYEWCTADPDSDTQCWNDTADQIHGYLVPVDIRMWKLNYSAGLRAASAFQAWLESRPAHERILTDVSDTDPIEALKEMNRHMQVQTEWIQAEREKQPNHRRWNENRVGWVDIVTVKEAYLLFAWAANTAVGHTKDMPSPREVGYEIPAPGQPFDIRHHCVWNKWAGIQNELYQSIKWAEGQSERRPVSQDMLEFVAAACVHLDEKEASR